MESYPKFHNEVGVPIVRIGCRECKCIGDSRRKITHTSTSIWAMPARSFARIARRYSVSIRAWANMMLIRQIVLTLTWTELFATGDSNSVRIQASGRQAGCSNRCRLTPPLRGFGNSSKRRRAVAYTVEDPSERHSRRCAPRVATDFHPR